MKTLFTVVLLMLLSALALAQDPCAKLGDGAKDFTIAAGQSLKVPLGGNSGCAYLKVDSGSVEWSLWSRVFGNWVRVKPLKVGTGVAALGDSTATVTEDDPGEWIGVTNGGSVMILHADPVIATEGRLRWSLVK